MKNVIVITGPPGSGKTKLAEVLSDIYDAKIIEEVYSPQGVLDVLPKGEHTILTTQTRERYTYPKNVLVIDLWEI